MTITVLQADYANSQHAEDIIALLDHYAKDEMGGGQGLSQQATENLIASLAQLPYAFTVLCYLDGQAVGLANCFQGFSTFKAKPLVNIHDLAVHKQYRGLGISQKLLDKVEAIAIEKGCCKVTLEVLEGNIVAKQAYLKFGFSGYELDPKMGKALFWQKELTG